MAVAASVVEAASAVLEGLGALSISLADPGGEPILEPGPGATPLWPHVVLSALLPGTADERQVRASLSGVAPETAPTFSWLEERDWVREFRENLAPLCFGDRLWICPEGTPPPAPGPIVTLEPGLAFGSGAHPTTALCLSWLAGLDLGARTVLDWGCGSGILALGALALGARGVTAVDIDPQALRATADNAQRNGLERGLRIIQPEQVGAAERYDIVIANILADTLIGLAPTFRLHCNAGARLALSGILAHQARRVCDACAPWLDLRRCADRSGWVLLTGIPFPP